MLMKDKFVKGTFKDDYYKHGPQIDNKIFNLNETIKLTITEFLSPTLFFGYESTEEYNLDYQINLFYDSLNEFFYFDNLPKVGTICVAKYMSDRKWYRAKVLNHSALYKHVDLYFIDYGNIERNVDLNNIRKIESTFSTQFNNYLKTNKNLCQAALFGFTGVKPCFNFHKDEKLKLKSLTVNQSFNFQIVGLPNIRTKKNDETINTPLFLIKNDSFSKSNLKLSNWLISEFNWEECSFEESLEVIIQSLCKIDYSVFNISIMIPNLLKSHQRPKKQIINQTNINFNEKKNENKNENLSETNNDEENVFFESSDRSVKDISDTEYCNENGDVLNETIDKPIFADETKYNEDVSYNLEEHEKSEDDEVELMNGNINEHDSSKIDHYCSVISWEMTPTLIESEVKGLEWHLPLPEKSVFRAIVTTIDNKLGCHINVCSENIIKSFKSLESSLLKHFLLCNNSMLRQFVEEPNLLSPRTICLCSHNSTYNRAIIISGPSLDNKILCKLLDYGYEIRVDKSDIIPISDQFCKLPPLAIECILSGFTNSFEDINKLVEKFEQILLECEYEVIVSLCLMDKRKLFNRIDNKVIICQPIPIEIFINRSTETKESHIVSINSILHEFKELNIDKIETKEAEPMSVSKHELFLSCYKNIDDVDSEDDDNDILELKEDDINGMNDIYINQQIHDQMEIPHPNEKKPVCEYYRSKGRCFKGSKCQDRHVMDSDCSDEEEYDELKWIESASYLNSSFERHLRNGSTIGMRVSAIYNAGIFYAYLTHGINGFDQDNTDNYSSDEDNEEDTNGLDFQSIHDMEDNLNEYMKYKYTTFNKDVELIANTLVAVVVEDKIHRASITMLISNNRYQVFLVDYGISIEVNLESLFLLPREYCSTFKQQCFMCKLNNVNVVTDTDSRRFAAWFYNKVNKRILHAKVIYTEEDGMNLVELYDFINDTSSPSINSIVHRELNFEN